MLKDPHQISSLKTLLEDYIRYAPLKSNVCETILYQEYSKWRAYMAKNPTQQVPSMGSILGNILCGLHHSILTRRFKESSRISV